MKTTVTMVLMFALMATGLMAQPNPATDGAFDVLEYVGTASEAVVTPNGQLPDAEVGINYEGAHVVMKGAENNAPTGYYVATYYASLAGGIDYTVDYRFENGIVVAYQARLDMAPGVGGVGYHTGLVMRAAYKKLAGYPASWPDTWYGPVQNYDIEIFPAGQGITYPPLLGSSGSGSGGGGDDGDDANCSAVAGASWGMPAGLITVLGALVWRRRQRSRL